MSSATIKIKAILVPLLLCTFILQGQEVNNQWTSKWDNGFKLESPDKNFKLKFGGRIMYDMAFFSQDDALISDFGDLKNGAEFRRVRFFNSGTIYSNIKYKVQLDFAGKLSLKDVFIEYQGIPVVGNLRVGHFKEPIRLEALTSSKYISFMERAFPSAVSQERNTGLMFHDKAIDSRLFWQIGVFRNGDGFGNDVAANDGINITARVAGLAINNQETKTLLHLGLAFSHRKTDNMEWGFSLRPDAHLAPKYLKTGTLTTVDNITLFGFEAALVMKSFSLQGEFLQTSINNVDGGNPDSYSLPTYYAYASYFFTGESRKYKNGYEGFDRIKPIKNVGDGGAGAWEILLRYSSADMTDNGLNGKLNDITFGVNWYLNPVSRIMFNYVNADLKDVSENDIGKASIFQTRFQLDF